MLLEFRILRPIHNNNNYYLLKERVMEQMPATPQTIDKLLESGFKLFKSGFKDILGILLTQTITMLVLFVFLFSLTISLYDNTSTDFFQTNFIVCLILSSLLILAVELAFIAAFTAKFWAIVHHSKITSTHAYVVGAAKALPLLAWLITYLLIVTTGLMILFIPGLVLIVSLFMGAGLIIQGHFSTIEAIKISHKLVWPYLRRTLLYLAMSALITLAAYFATIFPLGMFISYITNNNPMLSGVIDLARYALIVILVPLFVALIIPYYMDLLARQQNKDSA